CRITSPAPALCRSSQPTRRRAPTRKSAWPSLSGATSRISPATCVPPAAPTKSRAMCVSSAPSVGNRGRRLGFALLLAILLGGGVEARADSQIVSLFDFQFEDGTVMPELRIAYDAQGTLSPARDNAIVLLHDALGDRHEFDALIGPGLLFDTN